MTKQEYDSLQKLLTEVQGYKHPKYTPSYDSGWNDACLYLKSKLHGYYQREADNEADN